MSTPRYILSTDLYEFLSDLIARASVEAGHKRHAQGAVEAWKAVIEAYGLQPGARLDVVRNERD